MVKIPKQSFHILRLISQEKRKGKRVGLSQSQTAIIVLGTILIVFISIFPLLGINPWTPGQINFPFSGDISEEYDERKAKILGEEAEISLSTFNGKINLKPINTDEFRVEIKLRGTEEGLENIKIEFSDAVGQNGEQLITLSARRLEQLSGQSEMVQLDAELPEEVFYSLELSTSNGDIEVEGLKGHRMDIDTSNGRIILENVDFRLLDVETSNGRIVSSDGLISEDAKIQTSNGEIDLKIKGKGEYDIDTSNGKIEIIIETEVPTKVDAQTSIGDIDWNKTPIKIFESSRNRLRAETEDYEEAEEKLLLNLRTSNGSIEIDSPD